MKKNDDVYVEFENVLTKITPKFYCLNEEEVVSVMPILLEIVSLFSEDDDDIKYEFDFIQWNEVFIDQLKKSFKPNSQIGVFSKNIKKLIEAISNDDFITCVCCSIFLCFSNIIQPKQIKQYFPNINELCQKVFETLSLTFYSLISSLDPLPSRSNRRKKSFSNINLSDLKDEFILDYIAIGSSACFFSVIHYALREDKNIINNVALTARSESFIHKMIFGFEPLACDQFHTRVYQLLDDDVKDFIPPTIVTTENIGLQKSTVASSIALSKALKLQSSLKDTNFKNNHAYTRNKEIIFGQRSPLIQYALDIIKGKISKINILDIIKPPTDIQIDDILSNKDSITSKTSELKNREVKGNQLKKKKNDGSLAGCAEGIQRNAHEIIDKFHKDNRSILRRYAIAEADCAIKVDSVHQCKDLVLSTGEGRSAIIDLIDRQTKLKKQKQFTTPDYLSQTADRLNGKNEFFRMDYSIGHSQLDPQIMTAIMDDYLI